MTPDVASLLGAVLSKLDDVQTRVNHLENSMADGIGEVNDSIEAARISLGSIRDVVRDDTTT